MGPQDGSIRGNQRKSERLGGKKNVVFTYRSLATVDIATMRHAAKRVNVIIFVRGREAGGGKDDGPICEQQVLTPLPMMLAVGAEVQPDLAGFREIGRHHLAERVQISHEDRA